MKKHFLIGFLVAVLCNPVHAQWNESLWVGNQAGNWVFYDDARLDFNTSPPTVFTNAKTFPGPCNVGGSEGVGTISDPMGNLLFSISADILYDQNHQILETGFINSCSSTQTGLTIPDPGNPQEYYIFNTSFADEQAINDYNEFEQNYPNFATLDQKQTLMTYSKVDMGLNGGLGQVVGKNIPMSSSVALTTLIGEKITAVYHSNHQDVWIIVHRGNAEPFNPNAFRSNQFLAFLVTKNGINPPVISAVGANLGHTAGQMKASPDGTRLAFANTEKSFTTPEFIQVFDFNATTGVISNPIDLSSVVLSTAVYGLEFSPNSRYLYVNDTGFGQGNSHLFQFDLRAGGQTAILNSVTVLADIPSAGFGHLQLTPDGKIYMANITFFYRQSDPSATGFLSVVHFPNNGGAAAGFQHQGVDLQGNDCDFGLPGFIQNYFESGILHEGQCVGEEISFTTLRIPGITSINWDFGDGSTGNGLTPVHIYQQPGTYTVTATISSNGAVQTATTIMEIDSVRAVQLPDLTACGNEANAVFDLTQQNAIALAGQDSGNYSVDYFTSLADADNNTNPIANPANFSSSGQTIYVRVTSDQGCYATTEFDLIVDEVNIGDPEDLQLCETDGTGMAVFDLVQQNAIVLDGQDPASYSVSYFTSPTNAENNTNPIVDMENFSSSGQIIHVRVTLISDQDCYAVAEFNLIVVPGPDLPDDLSIHTCETTVDLTQVAQNLEPGLELAFYPTQLDVEMETNVIEDPTAYSASMGEETIYLLAKNENNCNDVAEIHIRQDNCIIPEGISPNNDPYNQSFDVSFLSIQNIKIFNRYGRLIYEKANYTDQWQGQTNDGSNVPTGTYFYVIVLKAGETFKEKNALRGWVYLNRQVKN